MGSEGRHTDCQGMLQGINGSLGRHRESWLVIWSLRHSYMESREVNRSQIFPKLIFRNKLGKAKDY